MTVAQAGRRWRSEIDRVGSALGPCARRDWPIGPLTTYRVGGAAALFAEIAGDRELEALARALEGTSVPVLVLGKGSNMLVADSGFPGVAVQLSGAFAGVTVHGAATPGTSTPGTAAGGRLPCRRTVPVRAGAAAGLPIVARRTAAAGLAGFEWAVGVPGSVGGGVRMNAGGHGSDIAASLARARVLALRDGGDTWLGPQELGLGYRRSSLLPDHLVVEAELALAPGDREASERQIAEIVRWRREHQPGGPNAGSVFVNPEGDFAGRLVEAAGAKGLRLGSAQVSAKHANFIQADAGGSAADVYALVAEVRRKVACACGVELRTELHLVGFDAAKGTEGGVGSW